MSAETIKHAFVTRFGIAARRAKAGRYPAEVTLIGALCGQMMVLGRRKVAQREID
jgi:hypothetical protein